MLGTSDWGKTLKTIKVLATFEGFFFLSSSFWQKTIVARTDKAQSKGTIKCMPHNPDTGCSKAKSKASFSTG